MSTYRVAGLSLATERPLPELPPDPGGIGDRPWTVVEDGGPAPEGPFDTLAELRNPDGSLWCWQAAAPDGTFLLRYPDQLDFSIDPPTRTVRMLAAPGLAETTIHHLLIDQLVPHLAALQGDLVLHASAVTHGADRALAFVGLSGAGKSSLAAAHVARGAHLLADDYLLLHRDGPAYLATPAYPGLRLWGDSATHFADDAEQLGRVAHYTDKRRLPVDDGVTGALPLAAIGVLGPPPADDGPACDVRRLIGRHAFALVYQQVFRMERAGRARQQADMDRIAELLETVPVLLVQHRRDYAALPEVLEAIDHAVTAVT